MRCALALVLFLYSVAGVQAQSLSLFGIDTTNFPTMKAKVYAFDAKGRQQSLNKAELSLKENGK